MEAAMYEEEQWLQQQHLQALQRLPGQAEDGEGVAEVDDQMVLGGAEFARALEADGGDVGPRPNQLTISFQGQVYVFDAVPTEKVSKTPELVSFLVFWFYLAPRVILVLVVLGSYNEKPVDLLDRSANARRWRGAAQWRGTRQRASEVEALGGSSEARTLRFGREPGLCTPKTDKKSESLGGAMRLSLRHSRKLKSKDRSKRKKEYKQRSCC